VSSRKMSRSHRSLTQTGWFSFRARSENHPSSRSSEAARHFLTRSATPPCGDASGIATLKHLLLVEAADQRNDRESVFH
jgi:hypothetical protein